MRAGTNALKARIWFSQATGKGQVIHYADDFKILSLLTSVTYAFSDRALVWPKIFRSCFVDDNDVRAIIRVR